VGMGPSPAEAVFGLDAVMTMLNWRTGRCYDGHSCTLRGVRECPGRERISQWLSRHGSCCDPLVS
jgi:hypothetical protein